jgi:hypothetical protein
LTLSEHLIDFPLFLFRRKLWKHSWSFWHSSSCSTCCLSMREFWVRIMVQHMELLLLGLG